jgi:hypothetical protein
MDSSGNPGTGPGGTTVAVPVTVVRLVDVDVVVVEIV